MASESRHDKTYALITGIEVYTPDLLSELNGPAHDALEFAKWLLKVGVPDTNIFLFLSPLEQNNIPNISTGLVVRPATRTEVRTVITDVLPKLDGDLLYFFWGGHGVFTLDDRYRLYYTDASRADKKNLDVSSMLSFLRSDDLTRFPQQIFIFDACANYLQNDQLALPDDTFVPNIKQAPAIPHEQFVLFAARPGQAAWNSSARKTGLLSEVLMHEFQKENGKLWPPDMEQIASRVVKEFVTRRRSKLVQQTPVYFWYQDWGNNKRLFGQLDPEKLDHLTIQNDPYTFSLPQIMPLIQKLIECTYIKDPESRQVIIDSLSPQITHAVRYHSNIQIHITYLVKTCLNYEGGIDELLDILQIYEKDSRQMQNVKATWDKLRLISNTSL